MEKRILGRQGHTALPSMRISIVTTANPAIARRLCPWFDMASFLPQCSRRGVYGLFGMESHISCSECIPSTRMRACDASSTSCRPDRIISAARRPNDYSPLSRMLQKPSNAKTFPPLPQWSLRFVLYRYSTSHAPLLCDQKVISRTP